MLKQVQAGGLVIRLVCWVVCRLVCALVIRLVCWLVCRCADV